MSDWWVQRTKDGTLWRVNNADVYVKCLKEGFMSCDPPEIVPVYPPQPPTEEAAAAVIDNERLRAVRNRR